MSRPSRKYRNVTRLHVENTALGATKLKSSLAASDGKHLMGLRVIMDEVIYAVAPRSPQPFRAKRFSKTAAGSRFLGRRMHEGYSSKGQIGWFGMKPSSLKR